MERSASERRAASLGPCLAKAARLAAMALLLGAPAAGSAAAATLTTLHAFTTADGAAPSADLVFDTNGRLYGATQSGGAHHVGTVFTLIPPPTPGGRWTQETLYAVGGGADGARPVGNLVFDSSGDLYGVNRAGGPANAGAVFEVTAPPIAGGSWTATTLYTFAGEADGANPAAGLVFDTFGNLYGTTAAGGTYASGTVFELKPPASVGGPWTKAVLFNFHAAASGARPASSLLFATDGALYGTTQAGSPANFGTVFRLAPPATTGGAWTLTTLFAFSGAHDGAGPVGNLIFDTTGALYGMTQAGGPADAGVVFKLAPPTARGGAWTETTLHSFTGGSDGGTPQAGLMFDMTGALFGATAAGGAFHAGTLFKLTPGATPGAAWTLTALYHFNGRAGGAGPRTTLAVDGSGAVFGATAGATSAGVGTVYEFTP